MNTRTSKLSVAFSRWVGVTAIVFFLCMSAMAFNDRDPGISRQSDGQEAASGSTDSGPKAQANAGTSSPIDANRSAYGNPSVPRDKDSVATQASSLTGREKFRYFFTRSFLSPTAYGTAIAAGAFGEWFDDDHHHHAKPGDFAADSATRAARSFAFGTTANFFEKFAYAALFKQDPRYHKSEKTGAGARITYAVSRLFVTRSDQGTSQFNTSFIVGGLTTAGLSNVWERDERRTTAETMKRWGLHLGFTAASNIIHEFFGKP